MTDLQIALDLNELNRLKANVSEGKQLLGNYRLLLAGLPLWILEIHVGVRSALHHAVIHLSSPSPLKHRQVWRVSARQ